MNFDLVLFYLYSGMLLLGALGVVFSKNTVRSALFLVLTFVMAAGTWMLLEAEFLAIVLVLVYVGAVMVLFLFVVMMLDVEVSKLKQSFVHQLPLALTTAGSFVVMMIMLITKTGVQPLALNKDLVRGAEWGSSTATNPISNVEQISSVLYTDYVYAFELAGVLLLVAIVAAIGLTFRGAQASKKQFPSEQVKVNKARRLKIISMPAERSVTTTDSTGGCE